MDNIEDGDRFEEYAHFSSSIIELKIERKRT